MRRRLPLRCALYHRVSTIDQDPTLARRELRAAAAARGMRVVLEVEEVASGARGDRPGLARVMDAARRGELDAVLVWKLDRFGRSVLDILRHVEELKDCGVSFVAITQGIEARPGNDPMSDFMLRMLAAVAEFERSIIAERTRLGLAAARRRGQQLGRAIVDNAPKGAFVAELRSSGLSWAEVAFVINDGAPESRFALDAARRAFERFNDGIYRRERGRI